MNSGAGDLYDNTDMAKQKRVVRAGAGAAGFWTAKDQRARFRSRVEEKESTRLWPRSWHSF
jgi:hypothetical protein